ncbi:MAG TPA: PD-(D/E)XK nuclease family protein [Thermodesulfobacteriota bacterium]|nr:PD-(D/E)XK nuclease family protein [Thermodesulfobacteriota bacterium]
MGKDQGDARFLLTGDYPALESAFANEIKASRSEDPFNPLLILVSSKLLGLYLRRFLAEGGIPHFNLRFKTLEEFAREVGTPKFLSQGKNEIPSHADELIIGHISKSLAEKEKGFYFRDITDHPGFHRAVLTTLRDLKDACLTPEQMGPILSDTKIAKQVHLQKLKDLLSVWKAYEMRLQELGWYDESDVMRSACQCAKESIFLKQTPRMIIYGFYDFNIIQKKLLQACFNEKETTVFLPYELNHAFEYVKPTLNWLKDIGFKETSTEIPESNKRRQRRQPLGHLCRHLFHPLPNDERPVEILSDVIQIVSAPGEPREVREAIREILQTSQEKEIAFHEIAVLLRSPGEYSRLFRETFDELGINPYLREGLPLNETPAGRSLLMLLNIMKQNFSRQSVIEFATFAKLLSDRFFAEKEFPLSPSQWDAISIQAGIVEGQKEWEERLGRLRESWIKKWEEEEEGEGRRRFHKGDIVAIDQLIRFTRELFKYLQQLAASNTWNGKANALLDTFDGFVEQDEESIPVKEAVKGLSELDVTDIPPSQADFTRLVEEVLQEEVIPAGKFQRNGPAVVNLMAARGVPFKMVIIPGMVEKSFPPLIRQDAILLDHERKILNRSLAGKEAEPLPLKTEGRLEEERLLYRLAIGAAKEKLILSFPRMEIGTGKERLPSSFLLASVKALTGESVDFQKFEKFPGFVRIPLSEIACKSPEKALDEVEFDISTGQQKLEEKKAEALLYLKELSPFFGRGLLLESSRWGKRDFTNFEGILSSKEALQVLRERYSIFKKSISPTRLEAYASCPYQYLLNVIMGIEALTEPEKVATINPLDKGTLIHSILWRFFTDLRKERGASLQLEPKDLERLLETANKKFVEFEQIGVTGYSMLWEVEKRSILDNLVDFFNEELNDTEFIPTYFEVRYGMKHFDLQESEISTEEPVPLKLAGKTVHLKGKIDRIDLTRDGKRARVRDYKTGKVWAKANDFQGGTTLQLPLYLYAARQLLGRLHRGIQVESAEYYSLKNRKRVAFEGSALTAKEAELQEILRTIAGSVEDGIFIAVPDGRCRYCELKIACGTSTEMLFNRKSKDPRVKRYLEMLEGEAEESGE